MNQQYKVILKFDPDDASSSGRPTVAECRDEVEHQVIEMRDALSVRGLGTVRLEWLTGLSTAHTTNDDRLAHFPETGVVVAIITIDTDYFHGDLYKPPTEFWIRLIVERIESACQLREPSFFARVGDLMPAREALSFAELLPIESGDVSITLDDDEIMVSRSGTRETFDFYFEALEFAGELVMRLEVDGECEVYRVGDGFVVVENGSHYYHLGALDTAEVIQFAADRITR